MNQMIETLRTEFSKIDRIDPSSRAYNWLCDILDQAGDDALKAVHEANIKFASKLAFNRMIRRGLIEMAPY